MRKFFSRVELASRNIQAYNHHKSAARIPNTTPIPSTTFSEKIISSNITTITTIPTARLTRLLGSRIFLRILFHSFHSGSVPHRDCQAGKNPAKMRRIKRMRETKNDEKIHPKFSAPGYVPIKTRRK